MTNLFQSVCSWRLSPCLLMLGLWWELLLRLLESVLSSLRVRQGHWARYYLEPCVERQQYYSQRPEHEPKHELKMWNWYRLRLTHSFYLYLIILALQAFTLLSLWETFLKLSLPVHLTLVVNLPVEVLSYHGWACVNRLKIFEMTSK